MRILNRLLIFGAIMLLSVASFGQNKRVRGNYAGPAYAGLAVVIDTSGYTVVDSSATPAIQTDSVFQGAMLQYDTTNGWESVDRAAVLGYKEYVALLTQSGTSAPVATVVYNDLGSTITWAYNGVGDYQANSGFGSDLNKVVVTYINGNADTYESSVNVFSAGTVRVRIFNANSSGVATNVLTRASITIRVYN